MSGVRNQIKNPGNYELPYVYNGKKTENFPTRKLSRTQSHN